MLTNYFQNSDLKVTKEIYFEMCEVMGKEPREEDIPLEISDFPQEIVTAFQIYYTLRDVWEPMSGSYLGKDMGSIFEFFNLFDVQNEDRLFTLSVIKYMDGERSRIIHEKQKQKESSKKSKTR